MLVSLDELEQLTSEVYAAADAARADELRQAARSVRAGHDARSHAVRGGALLVAYKLEQRLADLTASIEDLSTACELDPTPSRLANLASALLERVGLPGRGDPASDYADHHRAVAALERAIAATPETDPAWVTRATTLLSALVGALDAGFRGVSLDDVLLLGERVAALARAQGTGGGEPQNLLGGALLTAAALGDPRGDLRRAAKLLEESIALLPVGHLDRPARLSNLGAVLLDAFEQDGGSNLLASALKRNREAFETVLAQDRRRPLIANNLLNALVAAFRHAGQPDLIAEAKELFDVLESNFEVGDALFPVARSNLGNAAHAAFTLHRDPADLEAATAFHEQAIAATDDSDPSGPSRHAALSVSLAARYRLTGSDSDLDAALTHGRLALGAKSVAAHELARHKSDLGNLAHEAYLRTGSIPDLEAAATLHREGLAALPAGNPTTASLLNNAAVVLSDRFDRLGDPDDLHTAIAALERGLDLTPSSHPDRPARMVNLATNYHRRFSVSGEPQDLDSAESMMRRARTAGADPEVEAVAFSVEVNIAVDRWAIWHGSREEARLLELDHAAANRPHRPGTTAQHLFRRAHIRGLLGESRDDLLRQAARHGLEERPSVALEAGRQLALDNLQQQARGVSQAADGVREGLAFAASALVHLTAGNADARHILAWRRDAAGLAAAAAHTQLLAGDATKAAMAFESSHAALLANRLQLDEAVPAPEETTVHVWSTEVGGGAVLHAGGHTRGIQLPALLLASVKRISHRINVAAHLGTAALEPVLARASRELGVALRPLLATIQPGTPVCWCAGGLVAMLPIGIVESPHGGLVVDHHTLSLSPTLSLACWARSVATKRPLDLSNVWSLAAPSPSVHPKLEGAIVEASQFASIEHCFTGEQATHERALDALSSGSVVHFACHARTTARDPLASHLLLGHDTPLFAQELLEINSPARLVVLAACDTAAVRGSFVDEALGLATALHLSGVPMIVASLWPVPDEQTSTLMSDFAKRLHAGESAVPALRAAILDARPSGLAAAGAFVLLGA